MSSRIAVWVLSALCAVSVAFGGVQTWRLQRRLEAVGCKLEAVRLQPTTASLPTASLVPVQGNTDSIEADSQAELDDIDSDLDKDSVVEKEVTVSRARLERALAKSEAKAERQKGQGTSCHFYEVSCARLGANETINKASALHLPERPQHWPA